MVLPQSKRFRADNLNTDTTAQFTSNIFDTSASALLIDRMFAHLAKETEVMREWVNLERERLAQELIRRKEEKEREERHDKKLLEILAKYQEQFLFLSKKRSSNSGSNLTNLACSNLPETTGDED